MSLSLIIVGAGRVGLSLAADLSAAEDLRVAVVGRSPDPPPFLEGLAGVPYLAGCPPDAAIERLLADPAATGHGEVVIVFCVPDDDLSRVATQWSGHVAVAPRAALHTSGVHSADALSAWRRRKVPVAAWHPLVAVAAPAHGVFRGVWFGIDGEAAAAEIGRQLAAAVGGQAHEVRPDARAHYHVAGVFASNYLVACLRIALAELRRASDEAELAALLPLAESALRNLGQLGLRDGVTGPVMRGDVHTVASHLQVLDRGRADLYRALGLELLELTGDRLDPGLRARLSAELAGPSMEEAKGRLEDE